MREATTYHKNLKLMGNHFQISAVAEDEQWAYTCIDAGICEIRRIEKLLTTFNEESETALINRYAGKKPVSVSKKHLILSNDPSGYHALRRVLLTLHMVLQISDYGILIRV